MFEPNMDEYLDEEIESVKQALETICRDWERKVRSVVILDQTFLHFDFAIRRTQTLRHLLAKVPQPRDFSLRKTLHKSSETC